MESLTRGKIIEIIRILIKEDDEGMEAINVLKYNKSPAHDKIASEMLKFMTEGGSKLLLDICQKAKEEKAITEDC